MEAGVASSEKVGFSPSWPCFGLALEKIKAGAIGLSMKVKMIGKDDPRRIIHSLKVGLALTLVSIFYYVTPLFQGLGVLAMWAVLTVVVVMEYTVGGTLSKGLNRAFATMLAGSLGLGAHHIAILSGKKGEPIVLGVFVFLLATVATFSRFVPEIKKRYDYGVTIFILTFSLVTVSSYRTDEVIQLAHHRLSTIAVGVATCLCTSIFVFPVWAGEDLHKLAAVNLEKLASFLEGAECFSEEDGGEELEGRSFDEGYMSVLNSKATEESLANLARWEPGHGHFGFRHPWNQYLKIGALSRQCARSMYALTACITSYENIPIIESEFRRRIRTACFEMSFESSKALTGLALAIRTMTSPSAANHHLAAAIVAAGKVRATLSEDGGAALPEVLHSATVASLLAQVVGCAQQTAAAVEELARLARFKASPGALSRASVKSVAEVEGPHVVVAVEELIAAKSPRRPRLTKSRSSV